MTQNTPRSNHFVTYRISIKKLVTRGMYVLWCSMREQQEKMMMSMISKLIVGSAVAFMLIILPAAWNLPALEHPQLWTIFLLGVLAQLAQPAYQPVDRSAPREDRGTSVQIVWSVYLTQLLGVIEAVYFRYPESFAWDSTTTIALGLAIAGLLFRAWAVAELAQYFTWHICVQNDQPVVTTGPFRWVRHPGYAGACVFYVATLLFIHAWVGALLALMLMLIAFLRRIRYEEALLRTVLGEPYVIYARSVKALIPYVW